MSDAGLIFGAVGTAALVIPLLAARLAARPAVCRWRPHLLTLHVGGGYGTSLDQCERCRRFYSRDYELGCFGEAHGSTVAQALDEADRAADRAIAVAEADRGGAGPWEAQQ